MDWWSVAATFFAAASLVAVVWQILRFEGTQPPLGWNLTVGDFGVVTNGRREGRVTLRPSGPVVIHDVVAHGWAAAGIPAVTEAARMDCDSDPLVARVVWIDGEEAYAGFSWLQMSPIRRAPIRQVMRVSLPDGRIFSWSWYRIPRPRMWAQGRWVPWVLRQRRRSHVPDMWGEPGNR